jgi:hypothetical protein
MPDDEIKRQEAIHEIIYTEDDYVRDLKILDNVSPHPNPQINSFAKLSLKNT